MSRKRSNFKLRERAFHEWFKRFEKAGDKALTTFPVTLHSCFLAAWRESRRALLREVMEGRFTMTDGTPIFVPTPEGRKHLAINMHDDEPVCEFHEGHQPSRGGPGR